MSEAERHAPRFSLVREIILASRFGIIGLLATSVHITMAWLFIAVVGIPTIVANALAFGVAFGISFLGNYVWTFGLPGNPARSLVRFFVISATALVLNSLILGLFLKLEIAAPFTCALAAAAVIPLITYSAARLWGFK